MTFSPSPRFALEAGRWFKLICGASFQHLPAVRNLALVYSLAGADCVDVAADPAVIAAAQAGLAAAQRLSGRDRPWLMVSLNAGEDPHFRKAEFDPACCPPDCPRPCAAICPAAAIPRTPPGGVSEARCYGCGRCLPVCPQHLITSRTYVAAPGAIAPLLRDSGLAALEIHTQVGNGEGFRRLWAAIAPWADRLQLLAVSCPDGPDLANYLRAIAQELAPFPGLLLWQTDGRPMSGDLGKGATRAAVRLAQRVLGFNLPGYVQLAGGTNAYTAPKLATLGLLKPPRQGGVAGVAYGSAARSLLAPYLEQLEALWSTAGRVAAPELEQHPALLAAAVTEAEHFVTSLKGNPSPSPVLTRDSLYGKSQQ